MNPKGEVSGPRPLPAAHRLAPNIFYGWVVIFGAALLAFVGVGIGFYGQTVLIDALPSARGWSKAMVGGASSMYFVVTGVAGLGVGRIVDRYGPRGVIAAGSLVMAAALVWVGHASSLIELYLAFFVMAIGFAAAGSVPNNAIVTRWFIGLRARALAISQTGVSLGGVVLVPIAVYAIGAYGLELATLGLALLVVGVALPTVVLIVAWDPYAHGLEPDDGAELPKNELLAPEHQQRMWRIRDALRTTSFWTLSAAFGLVMFSQMSFLIHQVALMHEHMDATAASFTLSVTASCSIGGRLVGGFIADGFGKRRFAIVLFVVQALSLLWIAAADTPVWLFSGAALLGLTIGNIFMLQSLLVSELFGIPSFGTLYGMVLVITQSAGGMGPVGLAALYQLWGGYAPGLQLMAGLSLCAACLLLLVRAPSGQRVP